MAEPSTNGANGRGSGGRFAAGNAGGPGNPHAKRVAELRAVLLAAVTDRDLRAIVAKLVERAKAGELPAIRELLDRLLGKPLSGVAVRPDPDGLTLAIVEEIVDAAGSGPAAGGQGQQQE